MLWEPPSARVCISCTVGTPVSESLYQHCCGNLHRREFASVVLWVIQSSGVCFYCVEARGWVPLLARVCSSQTCAIAKNQGPRSPRSRVKLTFQDPEFPRSRAKYLYIQGPGPQGPLSTIHSTILGSQSTTTSIPFRIQSPQCPTTQSTEHQHSTVSRGLTKPEHQQSVEVSPSPNINSQLRCHQARTSTVS